MSDYIAPLRDMRFVLIEMGALESSVRLPPYRDLTPELAESVLEALARDHGADAAIAALPVTDTIKRVDRSDAVLETLDRAELWAVQTPQVFRRGVLERALEVPADELAGATDDALLVERAGGRVIVVAASDENLKVTTPMDLRVAELLLAERSAAGD